MTQTFRSRFVKCAGVRTHYSESGNDGPVIVGLHGGGAGSSGEAGMGPILKRIDSDMRFVALDSIGGFGKTAVDAPTPLGLMNRVTHLAEFADALCLDRFSVLGNSQGAWAAARYATLYPDRVERLIMIGSATIAQAFGLDVPITDKMKTLLGFDGTMEGMRTSLSSLVHDKSRTTDELVKLRYDSATRPGAVDALARLGKATQRLSTDPILASVFDLSTALPAFSKIVPTLFIWGEDDDFAVPSMGRALEQRLPDVEFRWVKNAGHQVQTDQPDEVVAIITEFMKKPAGNWAHQ